MQRREERARRCGPGRRRKTSHSPRGSLRAPLRQESDALGCEAVDLKAEDRSLAAVLRDAEDLASAHASLAAWEKELDVAASRLRVLRKDVQRHRAEARGARTALERLNAGWTRWIIFTYDRWRLDEKAAAADRAAAAASELAVQMTGKVSKLGAKVRSLRDETDLRVAAARELPAEAEIRSRRDRIRGRLAEIQERATAIEGEQTALETTVLARCRVLATTVHRTYVHLGPPRRFDTVVVDEASTLMPPLVYWAAGLATRSVTVAGDFRQLPPIVMAKEVVATKWLARDVFEVAGIPDGLGNGQSMPYLVSLGRQYRMRRPICKAVNHHFYADRPLRSHPICSGPSVRSEAGEFPFSSRALLYVDTAPYRPWASWPAPGDYSRYNPLHALLAQNVVLRLAESGYPPPADEANDAVGVIAPYRAQVRRIRKLLKEGLGTRARGVVLTAHSSQGNEWKAVVIDLTDSDGMKLGGFLQAISLEQTGARLLNVAVSRASITSC